METPSKVKAAAQYLIDMYGDHVEHLGQYQGAEAFYFRMPDDIDAGFPYAYLWKDDKVTEITGFDALHLLGRFLKD